MSTCSSLLLSLLGALHKESFAIMSHKGTDFSKLAKYGIDAILRFFEIEPEKVDDVIIFN